MISFKDRTFCASPNCTNECGRQLTEELYAEYVKMNLPDQWDGMLGISYSYYCGSALPLSEDCTIIE